MGIITDYIERYTAGRDNLLLFLQNPMDEIGKELHVNEVQRRKLLTILHCYNQILDQLKEYEKQTNYPIEPDDVYLSAEAFLRSVGSKMN